MIWNSVECPYCECENDMSDALVDLPSNENRFDQECGGCEREFEVEVEFDPQYTASEIVYEDCEICGTEERDIFKKGYVIPYPKAIKENNICQACFMKEMDKEYEMEGKS